MTMIWIIGLLVFNYIMAGMYIYQEEEISKKEFLVCAIPFFFVMLMVVVIVKEIIDAVKKIYKICKKTWK